MFEIASSRSYAPKCACAPGFAHICARKRRRAKSLATNIGTISKDMPTNFQLKQLKLKLDIVEKLTDSNGALQKIVEGSRYSLKFTYAVCTSTIQKF